MSTRLLRWRRTILLAALCALLFAGAVFALPVAAQDGDGDGDFPVETRLVFDPAVLDADRLVVLFLPEGGDDWQPLDADFTTPGEARVTQPAPGTAILAQLPEFYQVLFQGFSTLVVPGRDSIPVADLGDFTGV